MCTVLLAAAFLGPDCSDGRCRPNAIIIRVPAVGVTVPLPRPVVPRVQVPLPPVSYYPAYKYKAKRFYGPWGKWKYKVRW